jgi:hypothetical protein
VNISSLNRKEMRRDIRIEDDQTSSARVGPPLFASQPVRHAAGQAGRRQQARWGAAGRAPMPGQEGRYSRKRVDSIGILMPESKQRSTGLATWLLIMGILSTALVPAFVPLIECRDWSHHEILTTSFNGVQHPIQGCCPRCNGKGRLTLLDRLLKR